MIDGAETVYPIMGFDTDHGWEDLAGLTVQSANDTVPYLDAEGVRRLSLALGSSAACVIVERHYIDKDYRDTFSNYHSKRFWTPDSRCIRLHFFCRAVTRAEFEAGQYSSEAYLGYAVIRPTKPNCIGRTLLAPRHEFAESTDIAVCAETLHLRGVELTVTGFPFISQDCDVTVCAHSVLWMVLRYFSNRYTLYGEFNPFQVSALTKDHARERVYPSRGMYTWEMSMALVQAGFSPIIYHREEWRGMFDHLLYTYLESGFPLLVTFRQHVAVGFGHYSHFDRRPWRCVKAPAQSSFFNRAIIVNDDNEFPYQRLFRRKGQAQGDSEYTFRDIESFVVPLPEKVFMTADEFQTVSLELLDDPGFGWRTLAPSLGKERLMLRTFLTSCRAFKRSLHKRTMGHEFVKEVYADLPMPHFIWVSEVSLVSLYADKLQVLGEVIWDATRNPLEIGGWLALHYPELLTVDVGAAQNTPSDLWKKDLSGSVAYDLLRSNLQHTQVQEVAQ